MLAEHSGVFLIRAGLVTAIKVRSVKGNLCVFDMEDPELHKLYVLQKCIALNFCISIFSARTTSDESAIGQRRAVPV